MIAVKESLKCQQCALLEAELEASKQKCLQLESALQDSNKRCLQLAAAMGAANLKAAKADAPCVIVRPIPFTWTSAVSSQQF